MKTVDVTRKLEEYRQHADYTPETLAKAEEILRNARLQISGGASHLGALILNVCYSAWTTQIDTFAVTLGADAFPILLLNPNFMVDLMETSVKGVSVESGGHAVEDDSGVIFVLLHEASHLFFKHLKRREFNDHLGTMAAEATINYFVHQMLTKSGRNGAWNRQSRWMPSVPKLKADGTPAKDSAGNDARQRSGVDPWKLHTDYVRALREAGDDPVTIEEFYVSDSECLRQLQRMPQPPKPPVIVCEHMTGSGDGDGGGSGDSGGLVVQLGSTSGVDLDEEAVDEVVSEVLRQAIVKAVREGSESKLRSELLDLAQSTPEASKIWGDLGLGTLRGETASTRQVDWWVQWVGNQMASRMYESDRLTWDRSVVWETRLGYIGDEDKHSVVIAIDTSGSMPQELIDKLADLVGVNDQLDATWVAFDGEVWPFTPGETMQGGGGTNFQIIDEYVSTLEEEPDVVIVATDGYAPPFTPRQPDKWVWLITPDGDSWPDTHPVPMSCFPLTVPQQ